MIAKLKTLVPPQWQARAKLALAGGKRRMLQAVAWSPALTAVYYLFDPAYRREQAAVAQGLIRYHARRPNEAAFFLLRRNTHRLEKGLLMRPRRELFALDYIGESVETYRRCLGLANAAEHTGDLAWARDVLGEYFSVVGEHPLVSKARARFESEAPLLAGATDACEVRKVPYHRLLDEPTLAYDELFRLARRRRSVRWFLDRPVERELLDRALLLAAQAPSACNRQPFHFRIFDDPQQVQEIASLPMGARGFRGNIPMIAAVVGDLSAYFGERDRHGIYVDASLAIMAFLFALETLGLSSCPLNWPDVERLERKMAGALGLAAHERVVMCVAIGHPDPEGLVAYSEKRGLEQLRSYNRMGSGE